MCVCVCPPGVVGSHVTITHDVLDHCTGPLPVGHQTWDTPPPLDIMARVRVRGGWGIPLPVNRVTDKYDSKHYLPATSLAGGNN